MMGELRTRVIREVSPAPDFAPGNHRFDIGPLTMGTHYLCGQCGIVLAEVVPASVLQGSTMRCPDCDVLNEFGAWPPTAARQILKLCPSCQKPRRHPGQPVCGSCWWE